MIKITLFDACCASCTSGTACFFVDELAEFEMPWLAQTTNVEQIERFERSKNGGLVTDYYTGDTELNIVQIDNNASVMYESKHVLTDCNIDILNAYDCASRIYAKQAEIQLRYIEFQGVPHLVGRYALDGVCKGDFFYKESPKRYRRLSLWGNNVFLADFKEQPLVENPLGDWRDFMRDKEAYANDHVETFCWIDIYADPDRRITKETFDVFPTDELLSDLMRDIVGEAG